MFRKSSVRLELNERNSGQFKLFGTILATTPYSSNSVLAFVGAAGTQRALVFIHIQRIWLLRFHDRGKPFLVLKFQGTVQVSFSNKKTNVLCYIPPSIPVQFFIRVHFSKFLTFRVLNLFLDNFRLKNLKFL